MGYLLLIFTYLLYGTSNTMAVLSYQLGSNVYNLAFLNTLLPIPFIFAGLLLTKKSVRIPSKALAASLFLGVLAAVTTLTLNLGIVMVGVGIGTMLHMSHTIVSSFSEAAILHRKPGLASIMALLLVVVGIICMTGGGKNTPSFLGVFLALLSGVAYAGVMLVIGHTAATTLEPMQVQFYAMLIAAPILFLYGFTTRQIDFSGLGTAAWGIHVFVALAQNFGGFLLLQLGIRRVGAAAGSLMGSLEPVTSTILGMGILHETMTPLKLLGCVLIVIGVSIEPVLLLTHRSIVAVSFFNSLGQSLSTRIR